MSEVGIHISNSLNKREELDVLMSVSEKNLGTAAR